MRLFVLALDYDGTIARDGALDPAVRDAIAAVRHAGIIVLLVSGRILRELQRVAGDLHFVDGVVAENGAVLHVPATGHTSILGPRSPAAFLDELRRRGIWFESGECLVDAAADVAPQLLDVIRQLQVPLVLAFNGGRVMALTQGTSKSSGLQAMLARMRLSPRNTLAVGDAENDHELLRLAEVGVAVEWGSRRLQEVADVVVAGRGPADLAGYLRKVVADGRLPIPSRARRRLMLGFTEDGREFSLAVRGRNVLVAGDAKSGKSWVAGLLCEQLILLGYSVCVIDPEGDYRTLEALPGVTLLGGEDPPPTPRELLRALRYPDRSLVIDLSQMPQEQKVRYVHALLPAINTVRQRTGLPHRILLDEAHYFLHGPEAHRLLDLERNGYTIVTYRASTLPAPVLAAAEVIIVTCESSPGEAATLQRACQRCAPLSEQDWARIAHLRPGEAVALPVTAEACGQLQHFSIGTRLTPHVRHREKYVDVPVSAEHAFRFAAHGDQTRQSACTLRTFVAALERFSPAALDGYWQRGDFVRWIRDVFGDHALAGELEALQQRRPGPLTDDALADTVARIRARYDLAEDEASLAPAPAAAVPAAVA